MSSLGDRAEYAIAESQSVRVKTNNAVSGYTFSGANAEYSSNINLMFKFKTADVSDTKVTIQIGSGEEVTYTQADFTSDGAGTWWVRSRGMAPTEYDTTMVVKLYKGSTLVQTMTGYNLKQYIIAKQGTTGGTLTAMNKLARATYAYCKAAVEYAATLS